MKPLALSFIAVFSLCALHQASALSSPAANASQLNEGPKQKIIIDTDIGDDIDDAFAVGLALNSPEVEILGITSAWANTALRARLLDRLLRETGHSSIPVAVGVERHKQGEGAFSQARWAEREPARNHPDAVDFLLAQIRQHPGEVTLVAIGPETNWGEALRRDPETFKKLKRVVIMGGSVRRGWEAPGSGPNPQPSAEYNVKMDIPAAQAVFGSGVPLYIMPLDSTQLKLSDQNLELIFTESTPLADALTLLYHQWSHVTKNRTPTLFDPVAVAYAIDPNQCPVTPLRLEVDSEGYTREKPGQPNSFVCLNSDSEPFFRFLMPRLLAGSANGSAAEGR